MKKINFRWILFPFLAFLLGLNMARSVFGGRSEFIIILSVLVVAILGVGLWKKAYKQMIALLGCLALGMGWCQLGEVTFDSSVFEEEVKVEGRVTESISENAYYSYSIVLDDVKVEGQSVGNISLTVTDCENLPKVGQILSFKAELENVHPFTLGKFNSFYNRSGVRYVAEVDYDNVVVSDGYLKFDEMVRLSIKNVLENNMSENNAQTAYATLFGDKTNLDDGIYLTYKSAGIVHILTVSGLHVSFLISLIFGFMKRCKVNRYVNFILTSIFIIFYAYLCNFSPAVVRAGIMGIVMMTSKLLGRRYDGLNSLGLAGFIICLCSPLAGLDYGFLMSVFCVLAIFVIMPVLRNLLSKFMPKRCAELFALSISAQIGIFPILCLMESSINLLSIFANFIIVPLFGLLYPFVFVVSFAGLLLPFVGKLLVLADFGFTLIYHIALVFLKGAPQIGLKKIDFALVLIFYLLFFALSQYFMVLPKERLIVFSILLFGYIIFYAIYFFVPTFPPTISYICQYQQSAVILNSSNGQTIVVGDCYLIDEFASLYNNSFDVFISTKSLSPARYSVYDQLGVSTFIDYEYGNFEESDVLQMNRDYFLGDFVLTYLSSDGENLEGVRISFEQIEIFIASSDKMEYNTFKVFDAQFDFDLVFAQFPSENADFVKVSKKAVKGADYCYQKDGNIGFLGQNLQLRRLD